VRVCVDVGLGVGIGAWEGVILRGGHGVLLQYYSSVDQPQVGARVWMIVWMGNIKGVFPAISEQDGQES